MDLGYLPHWKSKPPTKTVAPSSPLWDMDIDYWLNDELTVLSNPHYKCSSNCNTVSGEIKE